ncbi:hypothetical protein SSYIS1_01970 [Serratia symbiotica]|uniref:Uncharacterized protein n=1 Tax=Serratia symbiotica TaxID=138074 RepID=A0A455VK21_9GAMM|nr:hypothetical protein SSYIS1_01970 [Serratia symbiotica]
MTNPSLAILLRFSHFTLLKRQCRNDAKGASQQRSENPGKIPHGLDPYP